MENGNAMFVSIIVVLLVLVNLAGLAIYPKSKNKLNGMKTIVLAPMALSGYIALCGWGSVRLWNRMSMPVLAAALFLSAVFAWAGIARKKERQRYFWQCADIIGMAAAALFAAAIALHVFGPALSIRYSNAVGGSQFLDAMNLLRGGTNLGEISFSTYVEAAFVGTVLPFTGTVGSYKAFLAAEIFLRMLEAGMLYSIVLTVSDRKIVRYAAFVITIGYFFGYPALSLLWANYDYWNAGALLFLWIIYALFVLEKRPAMRRTAAVFLTMALLVDVTCAQYYAAFHMVGVALALLALWVMERKAFADSRMKYGILAGILALVIAAGALFYFEFFVALQNAAPTATETAGMYRCMYGDLLFLLPALLFVVMHVFGKKQEFRAAALLGCWSLIGTILLYVLWYQQQLDTYYYFLNYYNLWLIGWVLVAVALEIMAQTKQLAVFFSYTGLVAALALLTLTNYDYYMWHHNVQYNGLQITKNFFALYRQSMDGLLEDYSRYEVPENVLEGFAYLNSENSVKKAAIVTDDEAMQYWGEAFVDAASSGYRLDEIEFTDMVQALAADGVDSIVVAKGEAQYQAYENYYERCEVLLENAQIALLAPAGTSWADIEGTKAGYEEQKKELFVYAQESEEVVPLMADQTAYIDFIMYENITGWDMSEYYTWKYNPVENLNNLNARGITQIVVLKDDAYYQATKEYFDRQEVVYENEAGYVLRCAGDAWSTQY